MLLLNTKLIISFLLTVYKNIRGETPLHWAAQEEVQEMTEALISKGASITTAGFNIFVYFYFSILDKEGITPQSLLTAAGLDCTGIIFLSL